MVAAAPLPKSKLSIKQLVDIWTNLPSNYRESELAPNFVHKIFDCLGYDLNQVKVQPNIGNGSVLKPDYLIYNDPNSKPILVVEIKRRTTELATASNGDFATACENHPLYKEALGLPSVPSPRNNGILQYLDISKVKQECLANYGLVLNGDFFQLWRRVDGLIIPMTPIQRVTKTSLPKLLKELAKCLQSPPAALVTAIWNRKGGVAKTTNTINVAACLALAKRRVLLVDLDPQNDLTTGIGMSAIFAPDYFDRAYEKLQLQEPILAKSIIDTSIQTKTYPTSDGQKFQLSLLSSDKKHLNLINDNVYAHSHQAIFNQILNLIRHDYDYIFIDSSPKHDKLTECLLCTTEAIVLPIDLGGKSLNHAIHMSQQIIPQIRSMRSKADSFTLGSWNLGLVSSNCPSNPGIRLTESVEKVIKAKGFTGKQIDISLTTHAQTKQAEFQDVPVVCWQQSPITKLFHQLTDRVFLNHNYTID